MLNELTFLVSRHPTPRLQSEYADGLCSAGAVLAVASHLEFCRRCAHLTERAGRLQSGGQARRLATQERGPWRQAAGGGRDAVVRGSSSLGEAVHILQAPSGSALDLADDAELMVVLEGVIQDGPTRYLRGDFLDLVAEGLERPRGGGAGGCVCLVVSNEALS